MSKRGDEVWEDLEKRWEEFEQRLVEQRSGKPDQEDRESPKPGGPGSAETSGGAPESELVIKRRPKA